MSTPDSSSEFYREAISFFSHIKMKAKEGLNPQCIQLVIRDWDTLIKSPNAFIYNAITTNVSQSSGTVTRPLEDLFFPNKSDTLTAEDPITLKKGREQFILGKRIQVETDPFVILKGCILDALDSLRVVIRNLSKAFDKDKLFFGFCRVSEPNKRACVI